ncbi:FG-GAP repeat domain-containing protein [Candidatus Latescibacterota bacterium]
MRQIALLIVAVSLAAAPLSAAVLELQGSSQISSPRLAAGDLDGDGDDELIAGGRVGPFVPVTEPVGARRAAIEASAMVRLSTGLELQKPLASYDHLKVVEDVGAGDVDGDGRDEIVAVGDRKICILALRQGRLEVQALHEVESGRLWRVDLADVDGDGRDEMAVAAIEVAADDGDPASSVVTVYDADPHLAERASLSVDAHIGDLCFGDFDGDGQTQLALELGREEIGGIVQLYDVGGGFLSEQSIQQLTDDGERALGLVAQAAGGQDRLALATVRGQLLVARQIGTRLQVVAGQAMPGGSLPLRSIASIGEAGPARAAELLATGGSPAGLWRVTGMGF